METRLSGTTWRRRRKARGGDRRSKSWEREEEKVNRGRGKGIEEEMKIRKL